MMDPLSHRLTLKTFKKHLLSLNSQFPSSLLSDLYKEIDAQTKGSIYFNELINYYLSNSSDNEMM
jgi:Ca2+-binding EF-hand superfamily protein